MNVAIIPLAPVLARFLLPGLISQSAERPPQLSGDHSEFNYYIHTHPLVTGHVLTQKQ